jgi:hypothetical protein
LKLDDASSVWRMEQRPRLSLEGDLFCTESFVVRQTNDGRFVYGAGEVASCMLQLLLDLGRAEDIPADGLPGILTCMAAVRAGLPLFAPKPGEHASVHAEFVHVLCASIAFHVDVHVFNAHSPSVPPVSVLELFTTRHDPCRLPKRQGIRGIRLASFTFMRALV